MWLISEYALVLTEFRKNYGNDALDGHLDRLQRMGNNCREPVSKHLGDGIWELRTNSKKGQLRVLYFFGPGHPEVTALHCFVKKRRKTDRADIEIAKRRRTKVLEREVLLNVYVVRN